MKILREKINRRGNREVTVEIEGGERLHAIDPEMHYKTGYPLDSVILGRIILESEPVSWCSFSQEWVP